MSQLVRNSVLFISQICRVQKGLRLNCEGSATNSRWVRDTRDDFATILRGILSHKIFEHVQNFRDYFAPLGDTCEDITNHWRLFRDCFATHSRCLSPAVAKQSQSSEIGALRIKMIAKLEYTQTNTQPNIEQLQTPTIGVTINNESTITETPP